MSRFPFKGSLAAMFCAAAALAPIAPALADGFYGGTILTVPPSQMRVDVPLTIKPSETKLSQRLEALQARFGNMMPDVKLIVIDKDWFQQNNILNGTRSYQYPLEAGQSETVRRLISEYVADRGNLLFNPDSFKGVEGDVSHTEGMALKFQYGADPQAAERGGKNVCLLFPHFSDIDRDGYYQALLNRNESIHGDIARAPVRNPADYEYMKRFVDYHEIGHCFDRWYIKAIDSDAGPEVFLENRHKAEVYGEVFANLMLARDGYTDFSEKQADLRLAIAALSGPISARMNDPNSVSFYMTYAYLLHEGSRNAGREIERLGTTAIQAMSMEQIVNLAHDITERSTFDVTDTPRAVAYMMLSSYDLSELEVMGRTIPAAQRGFEIAQRLKTDMEGAVRRVLDLGNRTAPVLQPGSFDFSNPVSPRRSRAEVETRAAAMARDLRARMGDQPSQDDMIRIYMQRKDQLRGAFELGSQEQRVQSTYDLSLMQMALKNVYDMLWPAPVPVTPPPSQTPAQPASTPLSYRMEWKPLVLKPAA